MLRSADKAALVLLARLDSRRLPGKGLMDLGGRPVLGRTIDRLRGCTQVSDIILATSDRAIDDALEDFANGEGIKIFRGNAHDVAGRCLACCDAFNLQWFVRICGDSPFISPAIVDEVSSTYINNDCDIATNVFPRGYPIGASAEAVGKKAMQAICDATDDLKSLEHVTLYAYENANKFNIVNVAPDSNRYANLSIAVDTPEELKMAKWIVDQLDAPETASLEDILQEAYLWQQIHAS